MGRARELSGKVPNWGKRAGGSPVPPPPPPTNLTPPVLTWSLVIGSSPTVTPGTWTDGAPDSYDLLRDATPLLTAASLAAVGAYVAVAADVGPDMTIAENASGPGGSASEPSAPVAWSPYTGMPWTECWDAAAGITLVSGEVDEWEGRLVGGLVEAQTVGGRPGYDAASIGGQPAVTFDGSTQYLLGPIGASIAAGDQTMLLVMRRVPAATFGRVVALGVGTALRAQVRYGTAGALTSQIATQSTTASAAMGAGDVATIAGVRDGAAAGQVQVWRDGVMLDSAGTAVAASAMDDVAIGALLNGTQRAEADIAFVGLAPVALTSAEWAQWTAYATWRWGI